jgi:hypothetical protein
MRFFKKHYFWCSLELEDLIRLGLEIPAPVPSPENQAEADLTRI